MKNDKDIKSIIEEHEKRISRLESFMSLPKTKHVDKTNKKLPNQIMNLREQGFFGQPKTADETHAKLKSTYHCELDRVAMALLRLAKRRHLRRATKSIGKKKYQAYVW